MYLPHCRRTQQCLHPYGEQFGPPAAGLLGQHSWRCSHRECPATGLPSSQPARLAGTPTGRCWARTAGGGWEGRPGPAPPRPTGWPGWPALLGPPVGGPGARGRRPADRPPGPAPLAALSRAPPAELQDTWRRAAARSPGRSSWA